MSTRTTKRTASWILALGALGLSAAASTSAQDEKPGVVEEDLGDGFRLVSVNGGPGAVVDDNTGMILKQAYGRTIIYDQETGATLFLDDEGEPVVKFKSGEGSASPERVARMKTFLGHAQAYGKAGKGPRAGEGKRTEQGKGKDKGKPKAPALTWDAVVAAHLQLLGADDETALALDPLLRAVLLKRDEIRRNVAPDVHPGAKAQRVLPGSNALPAAIDDYLRAFDAGRKAEGAQLEQGLAAYRAARKAQDAELAGLREQLREVLTVTQEAKLVAVGVLD